MSNPPQSELAGWPRQREIDGISRMSGHVAREAAHEAAEKGNYEALVTLPGNTPEGPQKEFMQWALEQAALVRMHGHMTRIEIIFREDGFGDDDKRRSLATREFEEAVRAEAVVTELLGVAPLARRGDVWDSGVEDYFRQVYELMDDRLAITPKTREELLAEMRQG